MTTSNSTDFSMTRDDFIKTALVLLGVYGESDTVSASDYTLGARILNMMVKAWEGTGVHLWTYQEGTIFLSLNKQKYSLSSGATDIAGDDVIFALLTADATGSSLTVDSTLGMTIGDNIGIKLSDGTLQWTTILTVPTTTTLTLNAALTATGTSGNNVFSFTNRIDRPLDITSTRFRTSSGFERPLDVKGRDEFMSLPTKSSPGKANQYYFSPKVSTATFYVWPTADDVGDCINISYLRRIQDFDASGDTADLPQEWLEAITYNLAVRLAASYGISTQKLNPDITSIAQTSYAQMQLWDAEEGSITICTAEQY